MYNDQTVSFFCNHIRNDFLSLQTEFEKKVRTNFVVKHFRYSPLTFPVESRYVFCLNSNRIKCVTAENRHFLIIPYLEQFCFLRPCVYIYRWS